MRRQVAPLTPARLADQMLRDSGVVMRRRLEIATAAVTDPARADLAELALMGSEKVEAFTQSAACAAMGAGMMAGRMADAAAEEAAAATHALADAARAPDAVQAAVIQARYALGWWGRAASQAMALNAEWMRVQAETMEPLRAAAAANAKRLGPSRRAAD